MTEAPVLASSACARPAAARLRLRLLSAGLLALGVWGAVLVSPGALAASAALPLAEFDPASLRDVAHANEALDAAARERDVLGRRGSERERACY